MRYSRNEIENILTAPLFVKETFLQYKNLKNEFPAVNFAFSANEHDDGEIYVSVYFENADAQEKEYINDFFDSFEDYENKKNNSDVMKFICVYDGFDNIDDTDCKRTSYIDVIIDHRGLDLKKYPAIKYVHQHIELKTFGCQLLFIRNGSPYLITTDRSTYKIYANLSYGASYGLGAQQIHKCFYIHPDDFKTDFDMLLFFGRLFNLAMEYNYENTFISVYNHHSVKMLPTTTPERTLTINANFDENGITELDVVTAMLISKTQFDEDYPVIETKLRTLNPGFFQYDYTKFKSDFANHIERYLSHRRAQKNADAYHKIIDVYFK